MSIGILALVIGIVFSVVGIIGIKTVEPPVRQEKVVRFPFPEEL